MAIGGIGATVKHDTLSLIETQVAGHGKAPMGRQSTVAGGVVKARHVVVAYIATILLANKAYGSGYLFKTVPTLSLSLSLLRA